MQMGGSRVPGVAEEAQYLAARHRLSDLDPDAPRLQVREERIDVRGNLHHHLIAAVIERLMQRRRGFVRDALLHAVADEDDRAVGDGKDLLTEPEVVLVAGPVTGKEPVAVELHPVDGKLLEIHDASPIDGKAGRAMGRGIAAAVGVGPAGYRATVGR